MDSSFLFLWCNDGLVKLLCASFVEGLAVTWNDYLGMHGKIGLSSINLLSGKTE
jgi:hypothetical protein